MLKNLNNKTRYLDLLEDCLTGVIYGDKPIQIFGNDKFDMESREKGLDWPSNAHTMIGRKRLRQLRQAVEDVVVRKIPGDLVETGVWRGGACILMRGVLQAYGVKNRKVWLFDSFDGLPQPDLIKFPLDASSQFHTYKELSVGLEEVQSNFEKYKLLDSKVVFVKGWFRDTLPTAKIRRIALLRLDGDLYESTTQALEYLYPKVSAGGYVIIDDYHAVSQCKTAVHGYLDRMNITTTLEEIDGIGVFWKREI